MENILFIRLRLLGDIIFTIPSIVIFKKYFPEKKIFYVVEERFEELAKLIPGIYKVIVVPYKMGIKDLVKFRREIRKIGFKTVIDFHSGPKSALLTFISGAKCRVGYRTPNRNWAYNHLTSRKFGDNYTHSVYNQAKLLEHIGVKIDKIPFYPELRIDDKDISKRVKDVIKVNNKIVIHIGSGNRFRDWGMKNFESLIKKLKEHDCKIFLVGNSNEEKKRGEYLKKEYGLYNFTGNLRIKDLLYLIEHSNLYFGVDSGPIHVASLTKTPIVALYGPNIPEISGPWREKDVKIVQKNLKCRPCSQRRCIYDKIKCMQNIKVEEVYEAIYEYIK